MRAIYEQIRSNRSAILKAWRTSFESQAHNLAPSSSLKKSCCFPVASVEARLTEEVLDWLIDDQGQFMPLSLQEFCGLKAVEETDLTESLAFIIKLKQEMRLILPKEVLCHEAGWDEVSERLDKLMLYVFSCYIEFRQRITHIKCEEIKRRDGGVFQKMLSKQRARERETV